MEVLIAVVVGILVTLVLWKVRKDGNRPPGPWGLPILGYIPFLGPKPYLELQRLAKIYGDVFSIRLGSHNVIVLNDFQSCKEAYAQDAYVGRPPEFPYELNKATKISGGFLGLPWKEQRRVSLHMLRDVGFGKSTVEKQLQEEIVEMLECFEQKNEKPFYVRDLLSNSMSNNIAVMMLGKRFKYDDPVRHMLNKSVNDTNRAAGQVAWILHFPWIKRIFQTLGIGDVKRVSRVAKDGRDFIMEEINEHERTLNPEKIRDFIDGYLMEISKRCDPAFNKEMLQDLVSSFFGAGSETVRFSVEWLVIAAAHHRHDGQCRIQAEIDEVVGRDRLPTWMDHKLMPYTEAFMMEMQRWRTLIPINLVRYTLADTELKGFYIPKHTRILANLWSVHHEPGYWGPDAEEFRPERFLTEDGKAVKKMEHYIPFSIGKRACPGEPLAKVEIFLYFTSILQKFDIRFPEGKEANFQSDLGISLIPKLQEVILTKRN